MEKISFLTENNENVDFFVLEQTRINGINYILVTDSDEDDVEAEAYILKDMSSSEDEEALYEFVEDDSELESVFKIFAELIDEDTDIKM